MTRDKDINTYDLRVVGYAVYGRLEIEIKTPATNGFQQRRERKNPNATRLVWKRHTNTRTRLRISVTLNRGSNDSYNYVSSIRFPGVSSVRKNE